MPLPLEKSCEATTRSKPSDGYHAGNTFHHRYVATHHLAKAGELDVLLAEPLPIQIPDAVHREAVNPKHPDGPHIVDWVIAHPERIQVMPTQAGIEQDVLLQQGLKAPHHGEYAAIEAAIRHLDKDPNNQALILYEDKGLHRLQIADPRVELISTGQFLREMELAKLIPSAQAILDMAEQQGATWIGRLRNSRPY